MQLINTIICSLLFEQTECASKSSCKYTLFKNILFMKINVSSKKDNAILFAFIKVVVTFYLRLRNEFQPFPAKNLASDWLAQQVNKFISLSQVKGNYNQYMIQPLLTLPSNGLFVSFIKSSTTLDKSITNFSFIPFWVCIGVIYKCIQVGYCIADKSQPFFFISSPRLYTLNLSDLKATIWKRKIN